jgi:hypothetical protein
MWLHQESVGIKANLLRQWNSGSYFLNFSLHSLAMRLKIEKILPLDSLRLLKSDRLLDRTFLLAGHTQPALW